MTYKIIKKVRDWPNEKWNGKWKGRKTVAKIERK